MLVMYKHHAILLQLVTYAFKCDVYNEEPHAPSDDCDVANGEYQYSTPSLYLES
jgi:hypothetical protein